MHLNLQQPFGQDYAKNVGVLVLGLGESGMAMVRWCQSQGANVKVADTRNQDNLSLALQNHRTELTSLGIHDVHFGELSRQLLDGVRIIAISPGLSPFQEPVATFLKEAQELGVVVWSEIELFSQALGALAKEQEYQPKVIAITGTNGKTTTTALTGLLCERAGKSVAVAGNVSPAALDKLLEVEELPEVWVLELSSFQLESTHTFNPNAAVVLNISQDHLDWHGNLENYASAKQKIYGAKTIAVINRDDEQVMILQDQLSQSQIVSFGLSDPHEEGAFGLMRDVSAGGIDWLVWAEPDWEALEIKGRRRRKKSDSEGEILRIKRLMPADALRIKGRHNCANALAALALCTSIGLPMSSLLHGLREYKGEPHRVQTVSVIDGIEYIDDSKGTNVGATIAALAGLGNLSERKKIILIAGGDGKGQDFKPLAASVNAHAKAVLLIGKDAPLIGEALAETNVQTGRADTLAEAVTKARDMAVSGDIVLLSPACASFDMFRDYAHRAQVFVDAVNELALSQGQVGA